MSQQFFFGIWDECWCFCPSPTHWFVFVSQAARWAGGSAAAVGGEQLSGWTSPQRRAGQDQGGAGEETSGEDTAEPRQEISLRSISITSIHLKVSRWVLFVRLGGNEGVTGASGHRKADVGRKLQEERGLCSLVLYLLSFASFLQIEVWLLYTLSVGSVWLTCRYLGYLLLLVCLGLLSLPFPFSSLRISFRQKCCNVRVTTQECGRFPADLYPPAFSSNQTVDL